MIKVLLSVFTCRPDSGTEPGNGWGWAVHLAKRGLEVHAFTVSDNREFIEARLRTDPVPGLHFHYVDYPIKGLRGIVPNYIAWQYAVVGAARAVNKTEHFDIAHHITFGSIHVPSQLWRLGIPVVFGPVGGGQTAPDSMLSYFGEFARGEKIRTAFTRLLRRSPLHRRWLGKMSAVLASNRDTLQLARALGRTDASIMLDASLPEDFRAPQSRHFDNELSTLRLLWVGRMLPRKAISLTLDVLAATTCRSTLTIIGDGVDQTVVRQMIAARGLTERVFWEGKRLPWADVRAAYLQHDALLFTSLRDSCAAQLLESMSMGLPIITLDLHGATDLVPDDAGFKVKVENPAQVVRDVAAAVDRYAVLSGTERSAMSEAGWRFSRQLTFSTKARRGEEIYRTILGLTPLASDAS